MAGLGCVNWSKRDSDEQLANARAHTATAIGRDILLPSFACGAGASSFSPAGSYPRDFRPHMWKMIVVS
jgi:hypothetical protein